ncbi:nucleic acid-binding protein [Ceratobasidium sp. AG-I]|nr:nucleic acid-binding protein [Ceratobasidium sp. AG-I]
MKSRGRLANRDNKPSSLCSHSTRFHISAMLFAAIRTARTAIRPAHPARGYAKLTLIGRLGRDPEVRTTKTDREYVSYTVATTNSSPPGPQGERVEPTTSWHRVFAFTPTQVPYLMNLRKGSQVYVEAAYEFREAMPNAEPGTPESRNQVFLRQEKIKLLSRPPNHDQESN